MRRRLLLTLMLILTPLLGAECDGSSSRAPKSTTVGEQPSENPGPHAPEPSAALVFGAGLLAAYCATRRKRSE